MGVCDEPGDKNIYRRNTNKEEEKKRKEKEEEEKEEEEEKNKKEEEKNRKKKEKRNAKESKGNNKNKENQIENIAFTPGESFYYLRKDINISYPDPNKGKKNLTKKVLLFFSLKKICNPNNEHSFFISIINSKKIGNEENLGQLENKKGENIDFGNIFQVDYFFEKEQILIIQPIVNGKNFGEKIRIFFGKIMSLNKIYSLNIEGIGTLQINKKEKNEESNKLSKELSYFQFNIILNNNIFETEENLQKIFYVIRNIKDGKVKRPVYKSHEYDMQLNKKIKLAPINMESEILCDNKDSDIFFELYIPSLDEKNFIGYNSFTLNQLISNLKEDKNTKIEIKSDKYGNLGNLEIVYNISEKMVFEDFIKKGQINLEIAIDYTESNGEPNDPSSLHYMLEDKKNDYEIAIKSCADIIAFYDSDQLFPVYGFGGNPIGSEEVSHCFNINFNKDDPNIHEVDNIIKFYKESLTKVKLNGPTYFSYVIKKVIDNINHDLKYKPKENHYYILMILTDGIINDMQKTIDYIVEGSKLPLSIVIIGVGDADFENMEILDGDKNALVDSYGEARKRDIVQFVQFNKFKNYINKGTELSEEVLKEIPRQVEEYYQFCGKFYE